ncbi:hypothetical protein HY484_01080 [Candidatus Woesearchaeota archaeon]|nr:hypothetical protein [Candidatus Woesearchaeota archaeon]
MSEEQSHANMYPSWPEICDPTKKFYDPFDEYSAHDEQKTDKSEPPKDTIDRFIREYGYFRNTTKKEIRNPLTGEWQEYTTIPPKKQDPLPEEEQQMPRPPREEYGPRACP